MLKSLQRASCRATIRIGDLVHETGSGTFETSTDVRSTAAFKGNADINRYPHLVLNFRDPAPPSPRGVLAYATPRRLPFRLMSRYLSSGMWPSFFSSFSKSALNAASASTIASKDFFTSAGKSSASMFCHFNSSRAIVLLQLGRMEKANPVERQGRGHVPQIRHPDSGSASRHPCPARYSYRLSLPGNRRWGESI